MEKYRYYTIFIGLFLLLNLAACGGSGDQNDSEPLLAAPLIDDSLEQVCVENTEISTLRFANRGGESLTSCTADTLPTGLVAAISADSSTCEITGTPTMTQSATTHTITATNATGSDTATVRITVNAAGTGDGIAPTATIVFPPSVSMTEGNTITVRGTAADDDSGVSHVQVNGVDATSADQFSTWTAVVPLLLGSNTLIVSTEDVAGNIDTTATQAMISRISMLLSSADLVFDSANNRLLLLDFWRKGIITMDLATGALSVLSDSVTPNTNLVFDTPTKMLLDSANSRVLVLDDGLDALIAVDLSSGNRTLVSDGNTAGNQTAFTGPQGIDIDTNNNRVLITDSAFAVNKVIAIDLGTGVQSVLSDSSTPNSISVSVVREIVVDAPNDRALMICNGSGNSRIVAAIDLDTGQRTVFSGYGVPDNENLFTGNVPLDDIVLDSDRNRAIVSQSFDNHTRVFELDLDTGARTILVDGGTAENPLYSVTAISIDSANNLLHVVDTSLNDIVSINLDSVSLTALYSNRTHDNTNLFSGVKDIALDQNNGRALVLDGDLDAVVAVDLNNGQRTLISSGGAFFAAESIVVDSTNSRALVTKSLGDDIISVDLDSGNTTTFSSNSQPDANNPFSWAGDIAIDVDNNRALVTDHFLDAVLAVDLDSGARTIFSDDSTPNGNNPFLAPALITVDSDTGRALVMDQLINDFTLFNMSLLDGSRTVISAEDTPDNINPLEHSRGIVFDSTNNRALVADATLHALVAVDLSSGARSIFKGPNVPSNNNVFYSPTGMIFDRANQRFLVIDVNQNAVFAVDLLTQDSVILSK